MIVINKNFGSFISRLSLAIILALLCYLFYKTSFYNDIQQKAYDIHYRENSTKAEADTSIVLVTIDDFALEFTRKNKISWPWPREYYAYMLDYFSEARAVLFDIQFYEPDLDRVEISAEDSDLLFAESIKNHGKVVLGTLLKNDSLPLSANFLKKSKANLHAIDACFVSALQPLDILLNDGAEVGVINIEPDQDGVIRSVPLIYSLKDQYFYPVIALAALAENNEIRRNRQGRLLVCDREVNTSKDDRFIVYWYGAGGSGNTFRYYSAGAVLSSVRDIMLDRKVLLPPSLFKDKYVIIGATAGGLMDLKTTPVEKVYPGMEIWATMLSNLKNGHFVTQTSPTIVALLLIFVSVLMFFSGSSGKYIQSLLFLFFILILFLLTEVVCWKYWLIQFPGIILIVLATLSYTTLTTINYFTEGKAKRKIKSLFSRYLDPDVVNSLMSDTEDIQLGGKNIQATVFFTDIADFTTYSEGKKPDEIVALLNSYFNTFTEIILKNKGLLDKFTGDGIMALYGPPLGIKDHAVLACRTALQHRDFCKKLDLSVIENVFHNNTRFGIHSGSIVVGNIGSYKRMDYTAIGDTVNTSARLEGVNKIYGTSVIISESTYSLIKGEFVCRKLDHLKLKGKHEAIYIYELISESNMQHDFSWVENFETALEYYFTGEWKKAIELFRKIYLLNNDKPAKVMLDRCTLLLKNPPDSWDGILKLEAK